MALKSLFDGWQKKNEKREKRKAKMEGRVPESTFHPITLALLVACGSILTLLQPLNILLVIFPLATKKDVAWNFRICLKLALMISIVYTVTILLLFANQIDLSDLGNILIGFVYNLAVSSLILYVGTFLVNYFNQKKR
ncbi:MAG: hypothetical protein JW825_06250 [Candidatus Methanofastidiosa archaeon]|nr:hypothetical protein [Candidatus Methanofastidiosa archaeon]